MRPARRNAPISSVSTGLRWPVVVPAPPRIGSGVPAARPRRSASAGARSELPAPVSTAPYQRILALAGSAMAAGDGAGPPRTAPCRNWDAPSPSCAAPFPDGMVRVQLGPRDSLPRRVRVQLGPRDSRRGGSGSSSNRAIPSRDGPGPSRTARFPDGKDPGPAQTAHVQTGMVRVHSGPRDSLTGRVRVLSDGAMSGRGRSGAGGITPSSGRRAGRNRRRRRGQWTVRALEAAAVPCCPAQAIASTRLSAQRTHSPAAPVLRSGPRRWIWVTARARRGRSG